MLYQVPGLRCSDQIVSRVVRLSSRKPRDQQSGVRAVTTALAPDTTLTAADRCDKCGAQAYVRVRLITGELHFCAHHAKQFEPKLKSVAVEYTDETARLAQN